MRGFFVFALCALSSFSFGVATKLLGVRSAVPPTIDGTISEAEWKDVPAQSGFIDEKTLGPALVESTFWISYDKDNIYFAMRNMDPNPSGILANAYLPNSSMQGDDTVSIDIDIIGKLNDFNSFGMNSRGANQMDISGGKAAKTEWLGEFITKARVTETGWEVEAKIPWNLMRLPEKGKRDLRFNVTRYYAQNQRNYKWKYTNDRQEDIPYLTDVEVPELPIDKSIKVLQYQILGGGDTKPIFNSGFDFRTNLARNIEAVGTINPDFRNVTQGVQTLNFSYFERLTDDNRPFFAEGKDYFLTGYGSRIFASQRVQNFEVGAKVFGKVNEKTQFGIMNLASIGDENTIVASITNNPSSKANLDAAVVNYRTKNRDNTAIFTNSGYKTGNYFFYMGNEFTMDKDKDLGHKFKIGGNHNTRNQSTWFELARVEKDFTPRLGFQPDRDIFGGNMGTYVSQQYSNGAVSQSSYSLEAERYYRLNGNRYRQSVGGSFDLDFHNSFSIDGGFNASRFEQFDDYLYNINIKAPRGNPNKSFGIGTAFGKQSGKKYRIMAAQINYRFGSQIVTSLRYSYEDHFDKSTQIIGNLNWDLGRNTSLSSRVVRRDKDYNVFFSYRKSGTLGTDYYLIVGDPNARSFKSTVILKVVYPFDFKI